MEDTRIVRGRRLPEKQARAREMRREMTGSEAVLWECLRGNRLDGLHFRRQCRSSPALSLTFSVTRPA